MNFRATFVCVVLGVGLLAGCGGSTPAPVNLNTPGGNTPAATDSAVVLAPTRVPTSAKVGRTETVPAATTATQQPTTAPSEQPTSLPPTDAAEQPTAPSTPPPAGASSGQAPPVAYFGANSNGEVIYNDQARALATVGGVQMIRTSIDWRNIEREKGKYNWSSPDSLVKQLSENNFAMLVMVFTNPDWAANSQCGPVDDLPAFEAFMRALAERYPQVKLWALYNEPDNSHYPDYQGAGCFGGNDLNGNGKPDVEDYAEQLRIAWKAIHSANPEAELVTGALAFDNFDAATLPPGYPGGGRGGNFNFNFPAQLFAYMRNHPLPEGEKYFDLLSFNFYAIYGPYWQNQAGGVGVSAKANMLNKLMRDGGVSAPLLVSETGADSYGGEFEAQSIYAVRTYVRGLASNIAAMMWFTFQDFPDSAPAPSNTWKYGLVDQNLTPKPVYAVYQTLSRELTGAAFAQPLDVQGGEGYLFTKDGGGKAVVWSSSDSPISVAFSATRLQVLDMYGALRVVTDGTDDDKDGSVGRIGLQVDRFPVYVQLLSR